MNQASFGRKRPSEHYPWWYTQRSTYDGAAARDPKFKVMMFEGAPTCMVRMPRMPRSRKNKNKLPSSYAKSKYTVDNCPRNRE